VAQEDILYKEILNYVDENGIIWERLDPRVKIDEVLPSQYIDAKVAQAKSAYKREVSKALDERQAIAKTLGEAERSLLLKKPLGIERSFYMIASEFVMAETDGANLKELLSIPDIDSTRTTCNNMYTLTDTLGIESARAYIIEALTATISANGSYIHPANITFIAEFITSRGSPYGATYSGISRQPGGHLSLATVERAGKVFTQSALHGRKEDIRSVSASVAVGARASVGTGYFDIGYDFIENGVPKTVLNDATFSAFRLDENFIEKILDIEVGDADYSRGIDELETLGSDLFDYMAAKDETDIQALFAPGEIVLDTTTKKGIIDDTAYHGISRRGQAPSTPKISTNELINVLNQIKVGTPLNDVLPTPITGVTIQPKQEILSSGLIPTTQFDVPPVEQGIPDDLTNLIHSYLAAFDQEETQPLKAIHLPELEVGALPDLSGSNLSQNVDELRKEHLKHTGMIDEDEFLKALRP
jgi:hypothetical protein